MSLTDNSTHSLQVVSGSFTTTFTYPNLFTLQLPSTGFTAGRDEIALKSLTLYYSWSNISSLKGNDSFSYTYNGLAWPVVLGDGIYSFADIDAFLSQVMIANGHYLVDENGTSRTFMTLIVNAPLYCLSLSCLQIPTVLPLGWTNPGSMDLAGNNGVGMSLVIPEGMSVLTGFAAGSYPAVPATALYQVNSGIPSITDVTSLNVLSNVVDSRSFSLSPNVLASFVVPNSSQPGSQLQYAPVNLDWVGMQKSTTFTTITVAIVNQLLQPIVLRDPSGFCAILNIRRAR